jgi:mRNA interferase HigB
VRIISERVLKEFIHKYSDSAAGLLNWRRIVRAADWKSGADVNSTFSNTDLVGEKTVFNIAQNRYGLIAYLSFHMRVVYVKAVLTHKEYDKGAWKI